MREAKISHLISSVGEKIGLGGRREASRAAYFMERSRAEELDDQCRGDRLGIAVDGNIFSDFRLRQDSPATPSRCSRSISCA